MVYIQKSHIWTIEYRENDCEILVRLSRPDTRALVVEGDRNDSDHKDDLRTLMSDILSGTRPFVEVPETLKVR